MLNLFPEDMNFEVSSLDDTSSSEKLEFKGSYLFDFNKGEFVKNPDGTIATCDDLQAYIQWCNMAMITPRYNFLAYSDLYGHEFKDLIGSGLSKEAIQLEIQRITKETLMVHPRTSTVSNFEFQWSDNKEEVYLTYEIITIDGKTIALKNTVKVG